MLGIFVIVTAEILPIGLLIPIAASFDISDGTAGLTMTLPGFVAAVAAPVMTVSTARVDRRVMLCLWMGVLAASNFLCAFATDFWMILAARLMVGLVIGGFWSIGAGLADRLVHERDVPRATSVIFVAVPLGSVLGVPAGTFIADVLAWRWAFVVLGVSTMGVLLALSTLLPSLPAVHVTGLHALRALARHRTVRVGLIATFLIVLAHFGTYTYVTPFLEQVTRIDLGVISSLLLAYGVAGIVGNFLVGSTMRRHLRETFGAAACLIAGATLLLPLGGHWVWGAILLLVIWGVAYGAVPACSQTWVARCAPNETEAATVLFTSVFQATIGIGALLGGKLVDATSVVVIMLCGAVLAAVGAFVVLVLGRYGNAAASRRHCSRGNSLGSAVRT
ncbi:MAG TPA: MFS transporter [Mycobacterium sp.]|nr:MFS transporter [Mycobacterium sp.]